MSRKIQVVALLAVCISSTAALGQSLGEPRRPGEERPGGNQDELPIFGPYQAIAINRDVVRDVKVDEELNVHLQLYPAHKDKEIVVKISNERFAGYREWVHGGLELVSPANAGKPPYGWTDWVQVKAKYIEYWMDGEIFLHLKRMDL